MQRKLFRIALEDLASACPDIEACAFTNLDGNILTARLGKDMMAGHVGALSAAMLHMGGRSSSTLSKGKLDKVILQSSTGYVLIARAGKNTLLTVITHRKVSLDSICRHFERAIRSVSDIH